MPSIRVPAAGEAVSIGHPNRSRRPAVVTRWRARLHWSELILLFPNARFEESRL